MEANNPILNRYICISSRGRYDGAKGTLSLHMKLHIENHSNASLSNISDKITYEISYEIILNVWKWCSIWYEFSYEISHGHEIHMKFCVNVHIKFYSWHLVYDFSQNFESLEIPMHVAFLWYFIRNCIWSDIGKFNRNEPSGPSSV